MLTPTTIHVCSNIGVSGTTDIHVKKHKDGTYEARMGISLLGTTNMNEAEFEACKHNPFHPKFYDNYTVGKGATAEEAVEDMQNNLQQTSNSLWI